MVICYSFPCDEPKVKCSCCNKIKPYGDITNVGKVVMLICADCKNYLDDSRTSYLLSHKEISTNEK